LAAVLALEGRLSGNLRLAVVVAALAAPVELAACLQVLEVCRLNNQRLVSLMVAGRLEQAREVRQFSRNLVEVRELAVNQAPMGYQR
jgi:hypothetical protein